MPQRRWLILIAALVPGAGLILLRREWLGICLTILFTLTAQIVVMGLWIIPLEIPRAVVWISGAGAIAVWCIALWLTSRQARTAFLPALSEELFALCARCREAIAGEDLATAQHLLDIIERLDDQFADLPELQAQIGRNQKQADGSDESGDPRNERQDLPSRKS